MFLSLLLASALQSASPSIPDPSAAIFQRAEPSRPTVVAPAEIEAPIRYGLREGKGTLKSKRVCFNDPIIGSKIPTRRCMDRAEFERRREEARDHTNKIQLDSRVGSY
ncbi:MAG: hypothetical protein AB1942_16020 [Pseudomonadota bacterium]